MPVPEKPDSAALVGVGFTTLTRTPDRSEIALAVESCRMAAEDAGIDPADVDGICVQVHHYPPPETMAVARGLGMKQVNWVTDGGPLGVAGAGMGVRAIESGECKTLFLCKILNTIAPVITPDIDPETGEVGGDPQFEVPFGLGYNMQRVGLYCRSYMRRYNITEEQAGWVAIVEREHAIEHPFAFHKKPLTMDDYLSSRWIAEPVRLLDCDYPVNGAFTYLMARGDIAKTMRHPPVWVKGWAEEPTPRGLDDHLRALPDEDISPVAKRLYEETGMGPKDMDIAFPYDGFSFFVPIWMENLGMLKRGEAGAFIEGGGRIRRTGEFPINTHGGNLSSGRMHGQGHMLEAVEQLRRSAGPRQIEKPMTNAIMSTAFPLTGSAGILSTEL